MVTKGEPDFPCIQSDPKAEGHVSRWARHCLSVSAKQPFVTFLGPVTSPWKELYRELVVGSTSYPLSERCSWTAEEICSHWNWVPESSFFNNSEFSLTWRFARNALPLLGLNFRAGLANMPQLCSLQQCFRRNSCTPSTTASKFAHSGITSGSGWLASNPSSSCCSTLVTSWTMFFLCFRVRSMWCFSRS